MQETFDRRTCDNCGFACDATEGRIGGGVPFKGWLHLIEVSGGCSRSVDFCSRRCLLVWIDKEVTVNQTIEDKADVKSFGDWCKERGQWP